MATVTVCNQTSTSVLMPTASGGMIALNGKTRGRITTGVQQSDWLTFYGNGTWLPALVDGLIYATVNS